MLDAIDQWLTEQIRPPSRLGPRVLVLCRTWATVSLVRRWAAHRGGVHGIDIATPSSLAAQAACPKLLGPSPAPDASLELPAGSLAADWIGHRPGLAAVARRWVRWLRLARLGGAAGDPPQWLDELATLGWGCDADEQAFASLVDEVRAKGLKVGEIHWSRAVALGFDVPPEILDPWEAAVLAGLRAKVAPPPPEPSGDPLPQIRVPDVAAEARMAVRYALEDPEGTAILVASEGTARRVRDALRRNGSAAAWRDRLPLRTHSLASAIHRCSSWFSAPDPWIQVGDLAAVLTHARLGIRMHPAAEALQHRLLSAQGLDLAPVPLTRRTIHGVLNRARILEAPLGQWLLRLSELGVPRTDEAEDQLLATSAIGMHVRLRLLQAAVTGRDPSDALADQDALDFDNDDFEAIVAELLGEVPRPTTHRGNTLGAVRSFLVACRVQVHDDPVARAILGTLGRRAAWAATPTHVAHALDGTVDPGLLSDGVQIVNYADWDGRPIRQVILLDVHDHGISRRPAPNPLLTEAEIEALGATPDRRRVRFHLDQARRAADAATRCIAVVTERDADGREVVAPVRLDRRDIEDLPEIPSYGIGLTDLPEAGELTAIVRLQGPPLPTGDEAVDPADLHPPAPVHPDPILVHLATQATAEWYREGRGPSGRSRGPAESETDPANTATLADLLDAEDGTLPDWVAPYLGITEGDALTGLPEGPMSATGLLSAASRCMYQAYASHVLGLEEPGSVSEELDPKEIGIAVHDALQRANRGIRWRVEPRDQPEAEETLVSALRAETRTAFRDRIEELGTLSPARQASADGRLGRWNRHWPSFAASRLQGRDPLTDPRERFAHVRNHPAMVRAMATARQHSTAAHDVKDWLLGRWLLQIGGISPEAFVAMSGLQQRNTGAGQRLPESMIPDLPAIVADPQVQSLRKALRNLWWRARVWEADVRAVAAEVPFGRPDDPAVPIVGPLGEDLGAFSLGPVSLVLGEGPVTLSGRVDRILAVDTQHGPLLEITDFKTGRPPDAWRFRRTLQTVSDPQLLVYAMVFHEIRDREDLPEAFRGATVATVAWDHVQNTYQHPQRRWHLDVPDTAMLVDTEVIERARGALGRQLDRGRRGQWTLRPRAETCPALGSFGHDYCPYAGACRLRGMQP